LLAANSAIRALQLHPANEGLWIMTASWEFNHNQNMQAARGNLSIIAEWLLKSLFFSVDVSSSSFKQTPPETLA